jgi:hypothetical protein
MHAVNREQHVSSLGATILKVGDNEIALLFDAAKALAILSRHTLAADLVQQNSMKGGAENRDSVSLSGDVDPRDDLASLITEHKVTRRNPGRGPGRLGQAH